jgi:hypothetical protein
MTEFKTAKQFFLFGTAGGGYVLWEKAAGAAMPASVSRQVVSRAKEIPVLMKSVLTVLRNDLDGPIKMEYAPPARVKRRGCRPLNKREIKKAQEAFFQLSAEELKEADKIILKVNIN